MAPTLQFVLGTRPEIIKLSPVIRECQRRDIDFDIVHTGQHDADTLVTAMFAQLDVPAPDHELSADSGGNAHRSAEMIAGIEAVVAAEEPAVVLVQGDTDTVLAGAIAVSRLPAVDLGHVEAGLRSYDPAMPEEGNRRLTDHFAEYLWAPTAAARANLRDENLPAERITVTGNTIHDAVRENITIAHERSSVRRDLGLDGRYALLTAHRAANVDDPDRFRSLLDGVGSVARAHDMPVVFPVHPRAARRIDEFDLAVPDGVDVVEPLDFLDFLVLEDDATIVLTDSGGVQEETCILRTPCVTLREITERPETLAVGSNLLVGTDPGRIREGVDAMLEAAPDWPNPFGDGTAAEQIVDSLEGAV